MIYHILPTSAAPSGISEARLAGSARMKNTGSAGGDISSLRDRTHIF